MARHDRTLQKHGMVKLRGHHLLCLHGFRGLGYDEDFIANMKNVYNELRTYPETLVEVACSPDDICKACPNLSDGFCRSGETDAETGIKKKDLAVIERLDLADGDRRPSRELFAKIEEEFACGIEDICSSCRWFSLSWCAEGIQNRSMTKDNNLL